MNQTSSIQNQNIISQNVNAVTNEKTDSTPKGVSKSDHMVYLGFMAMIKSMSLSEDVGASLADMSKTIYDTVVVNGTEKVKELQKELERLSFAMDKWDAYGAYIKWEKDLADAHSQAKKYPAYGFMSYLHEQALRDIARLSGKPPALPSEISNDQNQKNLDLYRQYSGRKSSMRAYVNGVSQQLSVQNTSVSNNKKLGDTLQQQVKGVVNDQSVYAGLVTNLLRIVQRQLQYGNR